jgi:hypothetical protein
MITTLLKSQSIDIHNKYYYVVFVDVFDKTKIQNILNLDGPIRHISLIYKPEFNYDFNDLLEYVKSIDKKYDWKLHEITQENYPITETIDVVLDTNIRKNQTTHYIVYEHIMDCDPNYINQLSKIFALSDNIDAILCKDNPYKGMVIPFSVHMILNKNNQEPLINKLLFNEKNIIYI